MIRSITACALLAALFGSADPARAATFCATNSAQLQKALTLASGNGAHDTIRIATGTYPVPAGGFLYDAMRSGGDDRSVSLSGGWTEFFDNPCGQQLTQDPWLTALDGGDGERVLRLRIRANSNVLVSLLTFFDGNAVAGQEEAWGKGGGIEIQHETDYTGRMTIERNVFYDNEADIGGGLHIADRRAMDTGRVYVVNNLFVTNHARYEGTAGSAAFLTLPDGHIYVTNNTALYNTADGAAGGFFVAYSDILVANNNLWQNDGCELFLDLHDSADHAAFYNNNIEDQCGDSPDVASGNIRVEPEFEFGALNFTPVYYSPLANGGRNPPEIGVPPFLWYLADFDLRGEARLVGPRVDIGAYESQEAERIFVNGFDSASP